MSRIFYTEKYDKDIDRLYIQKSQDIEPVLEENLAHRNAGNNGYGKSRNWRKIGSIPCIVVEKILREHGVNIMENSPEAEKYIRKFLQLNPKFMTVDKL